MNTRNLIIFNLTYTCLSIIGIFYVELNIYMLICWLFYAIGNGTIGHRYFAHNQFSVGKIKHFIFSIWCTLTAYSPIVYWKIQHIHHHKNADNEKDIHSPNKGILNSLYFWTVNKKKIESIFIDRSSIISYYKLKNDKIVIFMSNYFIPINVIFLSILFLFNKEIFFYFTTAYLIEHLRIGLINTITHKKNFLGNYRNHNTKDNSCNNLILGILGLGFGWHNNHHNDSTKLILTENWWEIDLEGYIGKILSKRI